MRKEQDLQVDACLWTKNSAEFLPATLSRFEKVVPQKNIHKKIMIDDHSTDRSAELGERWGWRVYRNESTGISSAANQALRLVTQPFFISLEHDVLLARNWWSRVSSHFQDEKVAIAQGLRLPRNRALSAISKEHHDVTLDNNMYRTAVVRQLGGFPSTCRFCTDILLHRQIERAGYKWIVDATVVSEHMRDGILREASHKAALHKLCTCKTKPYRLSYLLRITAQSPFSGLKMCVKNSEPLVFFAYPYIRLRILEGCLVARGN